MMRNALLCLTLACFGALCLGTPVRADVVPAYMFSDNAVLQRGKPIPVWGTAAVGALLHER